MARGMRMVFLKFLEKHPGVDFILYQISSNQKNIRKLVVK